MPEGTWKCSKCGQLYPLETSSCPVCFVTRERQHITGKITVVRTPKPPPEIVEVPFPFVLKDARFNLPMGGGALWSSGRLLATEAGFFLLSDKDALDPDALARTPPAAAGPVGPLSIFIPRAQLARVVHHKLLGQFIELQGKQKIPLRLEAAGWKDLDVICDRLGIPHE